MENKILLTENLKLEEKYNAIDNSLIVGFFTTASEFPVTSYDDGILLSDKISELREKYENPSQLPKDFISSTTSAKEIEDFDWRKKKGLENLFNKGAFLEDRDLDQLPDKLNFKISIEDNCSKYILESACNLAFRFGMEVTEIEGSIIADDKWDGNTIVFKNDKDCGMELKEEKDRTIVYINGDGEELVSFISSICEKFPIVKEGNRWIDLLQYMTDSFSMRNLDGQLAYLNKYVNELNYDIKAYVSSEIKEKNDNVKKVFPNIEFENFKAKKKIYEIEYDIPWEVDIFKDILEKELYPILNSNDVVQIKACLSEDKNVRNKLNDEINKRLSSLGIENIDTEIVCSYKQGFSWIEEIVVPKLEIGNISKIDLMFKPFLREGEEILQDEDGATPTHGSLKDDDPENWFDLPIRYLQELYPIDDLLAEKLKINREQINFIAYEGDEDITYKIDVFNLNNEIQFSSKYKVKYSERPYLDRYPNMGKVHPSTGAVEILVNDKLIISKKIKTDLENIWDIYQKNVLPECKEFILNKLDGDLNISKQPFFSELRLEIEVSEPDYSLNYREDQISSLNSFHEDIYFVGSDYFKYYGLEKINSPIDAPGLILPIIKKLEGKPKFKISLFDEIEEEPCIRDVNNTIKSEYNRKEIELYIKKVLYRDGKRILVLKTNVDKELIDSYIQLFNKNILEIENLIDNIDVLRIETNTNIFDVNISIKEEIKKDLSITDIDLHESSLIGYDEYLEIISKLKRVKGISVYKVARSYLGRDIYAIELLPKDKGYISRTKRITNYPSELINSRHHANEVSSTNSAFILLKKILTEEKYKDLAEVMDLVIVPMENVDGTAIHYELQKDNPYWKLHVARFNGIGKEFYYEHFDPDTIHTEAMAFTRLWERFLPDIVIDNHGVPSHEWEQQFSGYTSPSYKGFWLPRSLLYGYFWYVKNEEYKGNYAVNKKIEDLIAIGIGNDIEITELNKEWMNRFEKYAHSWMPRLFPAEYYKNMINYWIPFDYDENHRYPSIRYPWITTVAYTSEVADETAQGDYLNLCARAHVVHDEAVLEMMMNAKMLYKSKFIVDDRISISHIRQRPIVV